jgi:dTMP kinase
MLVSKGFFITIEGIEGVGKSTAVNFLREDFKRKKIDAIFTREPGGTKSAEHIRNLLLSKKLENISPETELLLMFASRVEHVNELIMPALNNGKIVVSDRFYDASYAYQGAGRGMSLDIIESLKKWALQDLTPDLTLLLDVPLDVSLDRIARRKELDRIEKEDRCFFARVRSQYLDLAKNNKRFVVIDAGCSLEDVRLQITKALNEKIILEKA